MRCDEPGALYCLRGNGWRLRRSVCGRRPGPLCLPSGDYARLPGPIQKHFCRILESGQYSPFFGLFQGFGTPFSIPDERSRNSGMGLMTTGSAVHQATRNGSRPAPLLVLTSELAEPHPFRIGRSDHSVTAQGIEGRYTPRRHGAELSSQDRDTCLSTRWIPAQTQWEEMRDRYRT